MHYCIHNIYHVCYETQWNFHHFNKSSHITVTSPKQKWKRVADTVRHFYHLLLWREEFYFDVVGNFEPKKITPNCNALAKSIVSNLGVFYFQLIFLKVYNYVVYKQKSMQWRHWSVHIALCDINKGVEIGERQNRCHR